MIKSEKLHKLPLLLGLFPAVGLLLFLLSLAATPFFSAIAEKQQLQNKRWLERAETLQQEEETARRWSRAGEEYERFSRELLLQEDDYTDFRRRLIGILQGNSLAVHKMTYNSRRLDRGIERISFNFTISGTYQATKNFIQEIESLDKIVFFSKLVFNADSGRLTTQCQLEVHFAR